jgi:hypothetical protein
MLCHWVSVHRRFEGTCYLRLGLLGPEDRGTVVLRNAENVTSQKTGIQQHRRGPITTLWRNN